MNRKILKAPLSEDDVLPHLDAATQAPQRRKLRRRILGDRVRRRRQDLAAKAHRRTVGQGERVFRDNALGRPANLVENEFEGGHDGVHPLHQLVTRRWSSSSKGRRFSKSLVPP